MSAIRDIAEQIAKYKNKILKSANVGDYVVFGSYQQDSKTSNGKEDIAWLVLAKEDNKVLVIRGLEAPKFQLYFASFTGQSVYSAVYSLMYLVRRYCDKPVSSLACLAVISCLIK